MTITERTAPTSPACRRRVPAPRLSLVVPAYNEAERLGRSIPRLLEVIPHEETEVIIVDDGSTDGTSEVASSQLAALPHSSIIRLPRNSGKGAAVRAGVVEARGEIIAYMDADMATEPGDLALLIDALRVTPRRHRFAGPRFVGGAGQERPAPAHDPHLRAGRRQCRRPADQRHPVRLQGLSRLGGQTAVPRRAGRQFRLRHRGPDPGLPARPRDGGGPCPLDGDGRQQGPCRQGLPEDALRRRTDAPAGRADTDPRRRHAGHEPSGGCGPPAPRASVPSTPCSRGTTASSPCSPASPDRGGRSGARDPGQGPVTPPAARRADDGDARTS